MAEAKEKDAVLIFHVGDSHGPMDTGHGRLIPGQSLSVPKAVAERLTRAYKHVKYASDVIPAGAQLSPSEKAKYEARIKELEAKVVEAQKAEKAALERVAELEAKEKPGKKAEKSPAGAAA